MELVCGLRNVAHRSRTYLSAEGLVVPATVGWCLAGVRRRNRGGYISLGRRFTRSRTRFIDHPLIACALRDDAGVTGRPC